jgi:cytochrome bd-type quinol oxidase subunit 2
MKRSIKTFIKAAVAFVLAAIMILFPLMSCSAETLPEISDAEHELTVKTYFMEVLQQNLWLIIAIILVAVAFLVYKVVSKKKNRPVDMDDDIQDDETKL